MGFCRKGVECLSKEECHVGSLLWGWCRVQDWEEQESRGLESSLGQGLTVT